MALVNNWVTQHQDLFTKWLDQHKADVAFLNESLSKLHSVSQVHTVEAQQVGIVQGSVWKDYTEHIVKLCLPDEDANHTGAHINHAAAEKELRGFLENVPFYDSAINKIFELHLNYELGGSQYLSCTKFLCKKAADGRLFIAYAMFGKKWDEQKNYRLNIRFWTENEDKVKNFLESGVTERLVQALSSPGAQGAISELEQASCNPTLLQTPAVPDQKVVEPDEPPPVEKVIGGVGGDTRACILEEAKQKNRIGEIHVHVGDVVDLIEVKRIDGTGQACGGGGGHVLTAFHIEEGEYVTDVSWWRADYYGAMVVNGVRFHTNKGRFFGTDENEGENWQTVHAAEGQHVVGLRMVRDHRGFVGNITKVLLE